MFNQRISYHVARKSLPFPAMGQAASQNSPSPSKCPVPHDTPKKPAECPVPHEKPAQCPVDHSALNQMPVLSQSPSPQQSTYLPTNRTESSIPRDTSGTRWEYPSPQQFYNALVRKGWETPEEHVETMVEIHNFLNEEAWQEVMKWERRADNR